MSIVALYGFKATFLGNSEIDYDHPKIGDTHQCLLFLAQEFPLSDQNTAQEICAKYGLQDLKFILFAPLDAESLSTDIYSGFIDSYEDALENGHSLIYYPNDLSNK